MYALVDAIFDHPWVERAGSQRSCFSKVKQDPVFGTFMELRTNASLQLPFHEVGHALWQSMTRVCAPGQPLNFQLKVGFVRVVTGSLHAPAFLLLGLSHHGILYMLLLFIDM